MSNGDASAQALQLLGELVRFNTVNPPGDERAAQEHLAALLSVAGFECELLGATEQRPNLVARLRGERAGPVLCLLGHVDTVLADRSEWSHDPWSGDVADGFLWGRGSLDMKSQVAAEVAAAASLARSGWRPGGGDLLIVAVVDEETGGELGAQWLCEHHPEKVRCDMLINEGGGGSFQHAGRRHYGLCCAEKGVFRFTVSTDGVAAHASMPGMGDNALLKMAPVLARLADRQPSYELTSVPEEFLRGIGEDPADVPGAIARMRSEDPAVARMFEPMFGVTFTPTKISASEKINVIPSRAELRVDCRVPPGLGEPQVRAAIAEVLGAERGEGFQIDFTERMAGNGSPSASPLRDAIAAWVGEHDPQAGVVPVILPGFTDSRHFRQAFPDCVAYGFFPQRHQPMVATTPLVHSADERIDVRDLALATELYGDLALRLLG